jgi:hypothetical protein
MKKFIELEDKNKGIKNKSDGERIFGIKKSVKYIK